MQQEAESETGGTIAQDRDPGASPANADASASDAAANSAEPPAAGPEEVPSAVAEPEATAPDAAAALADEAPASSTAAQPSSPEPEGDVCKERRVWRNRHNKYEEETDLGDPATNKWYLHKRHLLIYTYSGKPVYSRYGSEDGLTSTTGTLSAIVAKLQGFFFNGQNQDSLRYITAGDHIFAFLERGPLWLVCISRCGDTFRDLVRLLDRVYLQVITILTKGVEMTLQERPNYDMRSLLGGTDNVVNNIVRWCTQDIHMAVDGFEPLPLSPAFRTVATEALRGARINNVLLGFLMAGHRIISIVTNRQYKLSALDLSLLINLIMSSSSLRTAESWTPVCLANLNDKAFAYAYISFVEDTDVGVVFLSTAHDGEQFYAISQNATNIKRTLKVSGCLAAVEDSIKHCPIDLRASNTDDAPRADKSAKKALLAPFPAGQARLLDGIIHAAYFVPSLQQVFSSEISPPYRSRRRTKMLFRAYGRCRVLLRTAKMPSQICIATDHECFYVSISPEFHMYLAVPRGISTGVIGQFYQWVRAQEAHIFLGTLPSW